jgi:hypothetical protein
MHTSNSTLNIAALKLGQGLKLRKSIVCGAGQHSFSAVPSAADIATSYPVKVIPPVEPVMSIVV